MLLWIFRGSFLISWILLFGNFYLSHFGPFSVYFHSKPALVPESFAGHPVVQLEVMAEVPWMSDVPDAS